jgi:crotonobetainyl-CoA:carnitine CoA-transferase CaiB-like acyl-CoA transferase
MNQATNYLMANHESKPIGTLHPNISPYGDMVSSKENDKLILAIGTDKQFRKFGEIIGLEKMVIDKFNTNNKRLQERKTLISLIQQKTRLISTKLILTEAIENNVPIGKIQTMGEVMNSTLAQNMILEERINDQITKRIKSISFELSN